MKRMKSSSVTSRSIVSPHISPYIESSVVLRPFVGMLKNLGAAETWSRSVLWLPFRAADGLMSRRHYPCAGGGREGHRIEAGPVSLFVFRYALVLWFFAFPFIPTGASVALIWFLVFVDFLLRTQTKGIDQAGWPPFFDLPVYIRFPYYLLAVLLVLSAITSLAPESSAVGLELWATYLVLVPLVFDIARAGGERLEILSFGGLIAGAVIVSAIGLLQFSKGIETSAAWIDPLAREEIKTRVYSVFDNPNMLSIYLVSVTPIAFEQFLSSRRFIWLGSAALILACLGLTFSRAGWASAVFGLTAFAILKDKRLLAVLAILIVLVVLLAPRAVLERAISTVTFQDSSSRYRITIWRATIRLIEDFWPSGLGLGHIPFTFVYPKYEIAGTPAAHTHNLYLQFVVETGVLGLIFFIWLCLAALGKALGKAWSHGLSANRSVGILAALTAALSSQLLYGIGDNTWYNPKNALLFWSLFGFIVYTIASHGDSSSDSQDEPVGGFRKRCDPAEPYDFPERSRPRILHVISDRNVGGAGRYVIYLLQQPAMREFDVEVACPGEGRLIEELSGLGMKVIPLSPACQDRSLSLSGIWELYRIMKKNKYDIVHSHSSLSARVAARLSGVRGIVYTRHGMGGGYGVRGASGPGDAHPVPRNTGPRRRSGWILVLWTESAVQARSILGRLTQRFFSTYFADAVIAVSKAAAENLVRCGVIPSKITVIENGVAVPHLAVPPVNALNDSAGNENTKERPLTVGTVGRLSPEKGHSVFVRAAAIIRDRFPSCRFLIVGDGPLKGQLQSLAMDLGLEKEIEFLGYHRDVLPYLQSMDVFALPSYTEAMPFSLLEAMALGLPVVASEVGGVPEVVKDGENGFLVEPGNEEDLSDKIIRLLESPHVRQAMGQAGRETIKSRFNVEIMARRVAELYRSVLAAR
ncbi:MAG TPA: glycosyltransferase [Clostridia bacterium]|nr:glycosyltransferase [Clostridia bacterium]